MKRVLLLSAVILAAVACSESGLVVPPEAPLLTPQVGQPVEAQPATGAGSGHVMKLSTLPNTRPLVAPTQLLYYGGHVISNVKVYSVMWGSNVDATVQANMPQAFANITDSPYMDWLQEYDTNITAQDGGGGTNQHIGRGTAYQPLTISPSVTSTSVADADIYQEINSQINAGNLPTPDANTIYMVYFPSGMTITGPGGTGTSCVQFCAYHNTYIRGGTQSVFYGVMPDVSDAGCNGACGNSSSAFDNETSVSSHELIEAVTDAEVGLAANVGRPMAWYDPDPSTGEIGDICNAAQDLIAGVIVQQEWSNRNNACITYDPTVPTPTPTPSLTPTPTPTPTPKKKKSGCSVVGVDPSGASGLAALAMLGMLGIATLRRRRD